MLRVLVCWFCLWMPFAQAQVAAQGVTPPSLAAKAWLLLDVGSQQVLATVNPDDRAEPASLTKLMTAYVVFSALKAKTITLEQSVVVSERAWRMAKSGSAMFLEQRLPVTVDQLIHGVIIQSGNDACVALAELIAGSEENFVNLMNKEAKRLGLANTQYRNASGLTEEGHYTTPRDLARLATAIIRDFPEYFPYYSQKSYTYNKITQPNRNRLLWLDPSVDGMKTGHTEAAGFCLVSTAKRDGRRLISVMMGTASDAARTQASKTLLDFGFAAYEAVTLPAVKQTQRVWKGQQSTVEVALPNELRLSVPRTQASALKTEVLVNPVLTAPLKQGEVVGKVRVTLSGQLLAEYPLLSLAAVPQAGWFGRTLDTLRLKWQ